MPHQALRGDERIHKRLVVDKNTVSRRPGTVHACVRMDQTSSVCLRDCVAPLCVEKKGEERKGGWTL